MAKSIKVVLELDDRKFKQGMKSADASVNKFDQSNKKAGLSIGSLAAGLAAAGTAALGLASAVNAARSVEDLGITLETLYGDAEQAALALEMVKNEAARLPIALNEIQSGVPALALVEEKMGGLDQAIQFTAGVASAFGMSFQEAAVNVQRSLTAGIGAADLFRDKGVKAFLGFQEGAEYTAEQTEEKFLAAFDKVTAANKKATESMTGQLSMVGDAVFQVQEALGAAFSESLKEVIKGFNDAFAENKDRILEVARAIGENLGKALKLLVDNLDIIIPLITAFGAAWAAIKFVALAKGIMGIRTAVLAMNAAILANPIGAVAAAIAAAAVLIVTYWDDIKAAAVNAAMNIELAWLKLSAWFMEVFSGALTAVRDKFFDLQDSVIATATAIANLDLSAPFESFNTVYDATLENLKAGRVDTVVFSNALEENRARQIELTSALQVTTEQIEDQTEAKGENTDATEDNTAATKDLADATKEAVDQWTVLSERTEIANEEITKVNDAYADFIDILEEDVRLAGLSNEEREIQITLAKAYEKAAKELGITVNELSEETQANIEAEIRALLESKQTKEDEAEAFMKAEEDKQKMLDRTLERIEENMNALTSASENAVERMEMEHEYMMRTIDLYGVEKDVAEALHEYNKEVAEIETKLENDIQALRAAGHEEEAAAMEAELENVKAANEQRRAEIAKTAEKTAEYQRSFEYGWRDAYANWMDDAANAAKFGTDVFNTFADGLVDAMVEFAETGKFSFKDLMDDMKKQIIRFMAEKAVKSFLKFLTGSGGGSGGVLGSIVGGIKSIFGFENGGYIPGNKLSIVGENGPELFMPASSGTIIPNFAMGGTSGGGGVTNVYYTISAVDSQSFKNLISSDPEFIYNVTEAGRRRVPA